MPVPGDEKPKPRRNKGKKNATGKGPQPRHGGSAGRPTVGEADRGDRDNEVSESSEQQEAGATNGATVPVAVESEFTRSLIIVYSTRTSRVVVTDLDGRVKRRKKRMNDVGYLRWNGRDGCQCSFVT